MSMDFPQFWMTPRVSLDGEEYAKALGAAAALGVVGGGIYDAMLAHCALKAQPAALFRVSLWLLRIRGRALG
jgi:hypothetical protein